MKKNTPTVLSASVLVLSILSGCDLLTPQDQQENERSNREPQEREIIATQRIPPQEPAPVPAPIADPETNNAPELEILHPTTGTTIESNTYQIEWRAADADNDELLVVFEFQNQDRNGPWIRFTDYVDNDGTYLWDLSNLESGSYAIRATVTDRTEQLTVKSGIFSVT